MNLDYTLTVNPDATLSGTFTLQVEKSAAAMLGIGTAEALNQQLKSGALTDQANPSALGDCKASENETYLILNCTVANAKASDVDKKWSLVAVGTDLVLHVVADKGTSGDTSMDLPLGTFNLTATFPGEISKVDGAGATQTAPNIVTISGSLNDSFDVTITGAAGAAGGANFILWGVIVLVILLALLAGYVLIRPKGSKDTTSMDTTSTDTFGEAEDSAVLPSAPPEAITDDQAPPTV